MKIGLVAEVKWEVREVCRQLNLRRYGAEPGIWGADLNGRQIRLCLSGMVPTIAKERVTRFLDIHRPDVMICSGLAGALQRNIVIGDIIISSETPSLVATAVSAAKQRDIPHHVGALVTVAQPVLTPIARRELAARSGATAVDMESQTVAALCSSRGIPSLALKAISDGLDDDLSPILAGFEVIHIPRIALWVIARPSTWPLAVQLARHSQLAADRLGHAVWATLNAL